MKYRFQVVLILCLTKVIACAQENSPHPLNIGGFAPPLRTLSWAKGVPIQKFEKGKLYVVEFWSTWCRPCKAAMPHLSALARKYKGRINFLAVDIYEQKNTSIQTIKAFVNRMGNQMNFPVAIEANHFMARNWVNASNQKSIPCTFVVDALGRVAWIGHPKDLGDVLTKIENNSWDLKEALSKRVLDSYLSKVDDETFEKVRKYIGNYDKLDDLGNPDSMLLIINEVVKKEPRLKYAPWIASFTFSALLRINPVKAFEFGKKVIVTPTYEEPAYDVIIGAIKDDLRKINIPANIYHLGAECYQLKIDQAPYPELLDMPKLFNKMAAWYELAGDNQKAIEAQQQAVKFNATIYRKSLE